MNRTIKLISTRQKLLVLDNLKRTQTNQTETIFKHCNIFQSSYKNCNLFRSSQTSFAFSTASPDPLANYTFQQLLQLKSTKSLTRAAQIMAELQIEHQTLQNKVIGLEEHLLGFSDHNKFLMDKIKSIIDNVKLQEQQNSEIQKRAQKELVDAKKYAISKVAKEILQVSDNLERSIKHSQKICTKTHSQTKQFLKQLQDVLKKFGIEEFNPVGEEFDPNTQESMVKIPVPDSLSAEEKSKKSGKVAECFRTGYMIKGRLLRSAHVVVYE